MDSGNDFEEDCYPWLSKENVEDRTEEDLSGLPEMVSSGHSVGGVVYSTIPGTKVNQCLTIVTVQQLTVKSLGPPIRLMSNLQHFIEFFSNWFDERFNVNRSRLDILEYRVYVLCLVQLHICLWNSTGKFFSTDTSTATENHFPV